MYYIIMQKGSIHYTDYIVQSSAANSLRFIIVFFLKPMEPSLLFWWVKVDKLLEEQRKKTSCFHRAALSPSTTVKALFSY